jgi:hypothetical protein
MPVSNSDFDILFVGRTVTLFCAVGHNWFGSELGPQSCCNPGQDPSNSGAKLVWGVDFSEFCLVRQKVFFFPHLLSEFILITPRPESRMYIVF